MFPNDRDEKNCHALRAASQTVSFGRWWGGKAQMNMQRNLAAMPFLEETSPSSFKGDYHREHVMIPQEWRVSQDKMHFLHIEMWTQTSRLSRKGSWQVFVLTWTDTSEGIPAQSFAGIETPWQFPSLRLRDQNRCGEWKRCPQRKKQEQKGKGTHEAGSPLSPLYLSLLSKVGRDCGKGSAMVEDRKFRQQGKNPGIIPHSRERVPNLLQRTWKTGAQRALLSS